jgi:hypothetical protein
MDQTERRLRPREKVRLDATLVLEDGLLRLPALLKNASPFGAKIEMLEDWPTPERFYVLFGHRLELCRVIWRNERLMGLAYED